MTGARGSPNDITMLGVRINVNNALLGFIGNVSLFLRHSSCVYKYNTTCVCVCSSCVCFQDFRKCFETLVTVVRNEISRRPPGTRNNDDITIERLLAGGGVVKRFSARVYFGTFVSVTLREPVYRIAFVSNNRARDFWSRRGCRNSIEFIAG